MATILKFPNNNPTPQNDDFKDGQYIYDIVLEMPVSDSNFTQANNLLHTLIIIPDKVKLMKTRYTLFSNTVKYFIHIEDIVAFNTLWAAFLSQIHCPIFLKTTKRRKKNEIKESK